MFKVYKFPWQELRIIWIASQIARIERNNELISQGEAGEFGRHITVRELKAEVPIHYLLNFSRERAIEAVNQGVDAARTWCEARGLPLRVGAHFSKP